MTATIPSLATIGRPYAAPTEMTRPQPERLQRTWRITIAVQGTETGHALASALQAGDGRHTIELHQRPLRFADGFPCAAADLLLIQHELIEQPLETCLAQLLLQQPHRRILVLGADMHNDYLSRLVRAGAHGYLNTAAERGEIRRAVEQIMAGKVWMEHRAVSSCVSALEAGAEKAAAKLGSNIDGICQELTRREKEILCQVLRGYAIKQIAAEVHLSHQGVKMHLARLFRKFGASNRNQLILAVLDRISPVRDLSASLCSRLRSDLAETAD